MLAECRTLNGCTTGDAKITRGYRLPARHVIHTVGPIWQNGKTGENEALASCYRRSIALAQAHQLSSLAFPAISTGVYRFPADEAATIAVAVVADALADAPALKRIVFCCFSEASARFHQDALAATAGPCAG